MKIVKGLAHISLQPLTLQNHPFTQLEQQKLILQKSIKGGKKSPKDLLQVFWGYIAHPLFKSSDWIFKQNNSEK